MKKINLLVSLLCFSFCHATIIVKDITDFTFTSNASLDFDFNSDGVIEFSFQEMEGTVGTFYDSNQVNFVGCGSLASGYGWDVMKPLMTNTLITSSSSFEGQGDAYINPNWAETNNLFPSGDSYIGVKFNIGPKTYYGWILVHSTGGPSDIITIKSYAYNNVPDESITAGQTLGINDSNSITHLKIYPNPTKDLVFIEIKNNIDSLSVYNMKGELMKTNLTNNILDLSLFPTGLYLLNFVSDTNEHSIVKLIKQ